MDEEMMKIARELRKKYPGKMLTQIARAGNGNEMHYVVGDLTYERALWDRDNKTHTEDTVFIGSSYSIQL